MFKINKQITSLLLIIAPTAFSLIAQTPQTNTILEHMNRYMEARPLAKVFLHTDRPYYTPGDTLWYSAYAVLGDGQIPDPVTGVLYVDFHRLAAGGFSTQHKTALTEGRGAGQLTLPDTLPPGEYALRAYSGYQRNFSESDFFERRVLLIDRQRLPAPAPGVEAEKRAADCRFFPESGNLLAGVRCRVAFKAVNTGGRGVDVRGWIVSERGDTAATFQTEHRGMGVFTAELSADVQYRAIVRDALGVREFDFVPVQKNGCALALATAKDGPNIRLALYNNTPEKGAKLTIVAHTRGRVFAASEAPADVPVTSLNMPKELFGDGVSSITVFDAAGRPLCERLIFLRKPGALLTLSLETTMPAYQPRAAVTALLRAKDDRGNPVQGSFSVAVTDAGQVLEDLASDHLASYLLLTSDLRGHIEAPAAYFDPNNANAARQLDLLMLTHGWRRFDWKAIVQTEAYPALIFPVERWLSFKGKITRTNGKALKKKVDLNIVMDDGEQQSWFSGATDAEGFFTKDSLIFADTARLMVQTIPNNDYIVTAEQPGFAPFNPDDTPPLAWMPPLDALNSNADTEAAWRAFLKRRADFQNIVLGGVEIKTAKKEVRDLRRATYGKPGTTVSVTREMQTGITHPLQLLQSRAAGVEIRCSGTNCTARIRGAASLSGSIEPLYLIDGVPVDGATLGAALRPADVASIDVIKTATAYGARGAGGVINFLTTSGSGPSAATADAGLKTFKVVGFAPTRTYYSPRYDLPAAPDHTLPDRRATVYWNPRVDTGPDGTARFSFFTSEADGDFRIEAQGMTVGGQAGASKGQYSVR